MLSQTLNVISSKCEISHCPHWKRFLVAPLCRNDTFSQDVIYIILLFFPVCVDKFLTDIYLLGLEVT